ncbi:unnamed protein product [Scytosiphon promiscuus]
MRLRFRGSCWDDEDRPESSLRTPIDVPSSGGQPSNLPIRSLRRFLRSEGVEALPPHQYHLLRRSPSGADLSQPRLGFITVRNGSIPTKQGHRRTAEKAQPAAEGVDHAAVHHHHHQNLGAQPLLSPPASLAFCDYVADPATALTPAFPFPKAMLTDRSARATLFSATHTMPVSPLRDIISSPTASSKEGSRRGHTAVDPPNSVGIVLHLLDERKVEEEAIMQHSPQYIYPAFGYAGQEQQQRFETITLDLDEEASAQLRKVSFGITTGVDFLPNERMESKERLSSLRVNRCNNMASTQDSTSSPVLRPAWSALHVDQLLKAQPMQPRRYLVAAVTPPAAGRDAQCTSWKTSTEPLVGSIELPEKGRSGQLNKRVPREAEGRASEISNNAGPSNFNTSQASTRTMFLHRRIDMDGSGDEGELQMYNASRPTKRTGLLSLLGSGRCEKLTDTAGKARLGPLASPNDQHRFDPHNLSGNKAGGASPRSLFPGRSPSIPISISGGKARRDGTRARNHPGVAGTTQQWHRTSRSGGAGSSDQKKVQLPSLAPLWAAIRKMYHMRSSPASSQPLPWETAPRRQRLTRRGQKNAPLSKSSVSGVLSTRWWQREPAFAVTDKLLQNILVSWRKTYAYSSASSFVRAKAREQQATVQQLREQQHLPPSNPLACPPPTLVAPPLERCPPPTVLPSGLASTPRCSKRENPAADSVGRPQGAPAYDGSSGPPVQSRSLSVRSSSLLQGGPNPSLHNDDDRRGLHDIGKGMQATTIRTSKGTVEGEGAAGGTQIVSREGSVESSTTAKAPGNKRKLDGIAWSFVATIDSNNDNPKRQAPARPSGATISRGGASGAGPPTTSGSDGAVSGELPRQIANDGRRDAVGESTISRGSSESTPVTEGEPGAAWASSRTSFAATPQDDQRVRRRAEDDVGDQRRRRSDGDGECSPAANARKIAAEKRQRRHTLEGSRDGLIDTAEAVRTGVQSEVGRGARSLPTPAARTAPSSAGSPPSTPETNLTGQQGTNPSTVVPLPTARSAIVSGASALSTKQHRQLDEGLAMEGEHACSAVQAKTRASVSASSVLEERSLGASGGARAAGGAGEGDPYQGGAQPEREEDAALAGCESSRQREILALIRAGTMGDTFNLHSKRRRATSGGKGRPQWTSAATAGTDPSRRHSDPSGRSTVGDTPSAFSPGNGAFPKANIIRPNQATVMRSPEDRPFYAVVSDHFVERAGSMVRTLVPRGREDAAAVAAAISAGTQRGGRFHLLELAVERPVDLIVGSRSAIVILDNRGSGSGATSATAGDEVKGDHRATTDTRGGKGKCRIRQERRQYYSSIERREHEGHGAAAAMQSAAGERERDQQAQCETAEAKEKLRLLQLQTLKYSTVWLLVRMDRAPRAGSNQFSAKGSGVRLRPALEKLEQWLVGFPCRVLIRQVGPDQRRLPRYSHSEVQLAELISHAATIEQRGAGGIDDVRANSIAGATATAAGASFPGPGGKRRRVGDAGNNSSRDGDAASSPRGGGGGATAAAASAGGLRSPLEAIDDCCRENSDWAASHHRQAWFLQVRATLLVLACASLLSCSSLKHLIVAPYEELAPTLLGRGGGEAGAGGGNPSTGGAARGGVNAESLRDFCALVRLDGEQANGES